MTIEPIPLPPELYPFADETATPLNGAEAFSLSAADKRQILQAWQRFLRSGCQNLFFSRSLYRFLSQYCHLAAHRNREQFWAYYFDADLARLRALLRQFGADRRSAEDGQHDWLSGPAADLKEAMCQEATLLYAPLSQLLQDLEVKYEEMIAAWRDFAGAAHIGAVPLPPAYQVSENSRHLLAYAADIALRYQRPLTGLQLRFPWRQPPLLLPGPVEENEVILIDAPATGGGS